MKGGDGLDLDAGVLEPIAFDLDEVDDAVGPLEAEVGPVDAP